MPAAGFARDISPVFTAAREGAVPHQYTIPPVKTASRQIATRMAPAVLPCFGTAVPHWGQNRIPFFRRILQFAHFKVSLLSSSAHPRCSLRAAAAHRRFPHSVQNSTSSASSAPQLGQSRGICRSCTRIVWAAEGVSARDSPHCVQNISPGFVCAPQ